MTLSRDVRKALSTGEAVWLRINPRAPNVVVPTQYSDLPELVLCFGYELHPPIPDLAFDPVTISGILAFRGVPFHCVIPWDAVHAYNTSIGPASCVTETSPETPAEAKARKRAHLKLV